MAIPSNTPITLPLFGAVTAHVPDYYVLPGKRQNQFKLVRGLTPSGKAFTTRQGHKAVKIRKNERNELYLEESSYNNPRIEYGMFSPKDQKILQKYFAHEPPPPPPPPQDDQSVVSSIMSDNSYGPRYTYQYVNGKKHRVLNQSLQNDISHEAKQHRKRIRKGLKPQQK